MVKSIKKYELNDKVNLEELKRAEFVRDENSTIQYSKIIYDDIGLHIALTQDDKGNIIFGQDGISIMDEELMKPYTPFFNSDSNFEYLDNVVAGYNNAMDSLVNQGIFKVKKK